MAKSELQPPRSGVRRASRAASVGGAHLRPVRPGQRPPTHRRDHLVHRPDSELSGSTSQSIHDERRGDRHRLMSDSLRHRLSARSALRTAGVERPAAASNTHRLGGNSEPWRTAVRGCAESQSRVHPARLLGVTFGLRGSGPAGYRARRWGIFPPPESNKRGRPMVAAVVLRLVRLLAGPRTPRSDPLTWTRHGHRRRTTEEFAVKSGELNSEPTSSQKTSATNRVVRSAGHGSRTALSSHASLDRA